MRPEPVIATHRPGHRTGRAPARQPPPKSVARQRVGQGGEFDASGVASRCPRPGKVKLKSRWCCADELGVEIAVGRLGDRQAGFLAPIAHFEHAARRGQASPGMPSAAQRARRSGLELAKNGAGIVRGSRAIARRSGSPPPDRFPVRSGPRRADCTARARMPSSRARAQACCPPAPPKATRVCSRTSSPREAASFLMGATIAALAMRRKPGGEFVAITGPAGGGGRCARSVRPAGACDRCRIGRKGKPGMRPR